MADFVDGIATTDVRMGGTEILRGLTIDDLKAAEKWYYNEYRGGRNAESYPHWTGLQLHVYDGFPWRLGRAERRYHSPHSQQ